MNCRNAHLATNDSKKELTAPGAAWSEPAEDRTRLYLLSFLLTADRAKAEQCIVPGLDLSATDNAAFRDWAHSWAWRLVINNALRLVAPHPQTEVHSTGSGGPR